MTPERWQRIEKVFHEARDCDAERRATYLAETCENDADLREQVESLLSHDGRLERAEAASMFEPQLAAGNELGPYRIEAKLGEGGMGVVFRALDTRLGRKVAIKVSSLQFSERFEREARSIAALNHPNVCTLYDVGPNYLVMELVEGETLVSRLRKGPFPMREVARYGAQIADALAEAHAHRIVHRDLKPANIMLTRAGMKVLDFGIAKNTTSPDGLTATHGVIGTPAYMAPEQREGKPSDARTDIFALGLVLCEMATGQLPAGKPGEPIEGLPEPLGPIVDRCLATDPANRWQSAADIKAMLEWTGTRPANLRQPFARKIRSYRLVGVLAIAAILLAVAPFLYFNARPKTSAPIQLSIPFLQPPLVLPFSSKHLAISDDGARVAYASANGIWVRRMDQKEPTLLVRSARAPFFSPDGMWIAFFDDASLQKIPVDGGAAVQLAASSARYLGGSWHAKAGIVFATTEGLYQVAPGGGTPRLLVKPNYEHKERAYAWPQFLPDGEAIVFTILPEGAMDSAQIAVLDLKSLQSKVVLKGGASAQYTATGQLVYASGRTLKAIAFDAAHREIKGDAILLSDMDVFVSLDNGIADLAVSGSGTLVFLSNVARNPASLRWMDRVGKEEILPLKPVSCGYPRVSPDGKRVALDCTGDTGRDIWILNLERMSLTQLTDGPTEDLLPMWSPAGNRIFFSSDRTGNFDVYSQVWDGASGPRLEFASPEAQFPSSFTPDGNRLIVYHAFKDLNIVDLATPPRMTPLLNGEFDERLGEISPDGKWLAYESDESGKQFEIMMRPFPNVVDRREQISVNGGRYPLWSPKGDELYYVTPNGEMMSVPVTLSPALKLGRPTKLFDWQRPPAGRSGRTYDVSPIDGRFIMTKPVVQDPDVPTNVSVVLNWSEDLRKRLPPR